MAKKEKRIQAELKRLSKYFDAVDENQRENAANLLQNAAFMAVTLQDLQDLINAEGVVDHYQNGATQFGTKTSAVLQSYNALVKNYATVVRTLAQLLPKETTTGGISRLEKFVKMQTEDEVGDV